ncbi:hypothetical protein [Streptomyces chartreusis]
MANQPQSVCRRGLHSLNDPKNLGYKRYRSGAKKRFCLPCSRITAGRELPPLPATPTIPQLALLQDRADGLTDMEIAERDGVTAGAVAHRALRARRTLGVASTTAAVGVCLAYGLITPATDGPLPLRCEEIVPYVASVLDLVQGRREPLKPLDVQRARLLDALYAWTEPHAVSVLWAAGLITPREIAPLFAKEK